VSILKALLKDGRKSFREISRETGITTPTIKARFNRLVNVGFIKSVSPILDFNIVEESIGKSELENRNGGENSKTIKESEEGKKNKKEKQYNNNNQLQLQLQDAKSKIKKGMKIKLLVNSVKDLFMVILRCLNLQIMSDFSAVLDAYLVTRKNMLEE
jgi:DNA-binding Lrp family transcriptional regulator